MNISINKTTMKDPNNPCLFCNILKKDLVFENNLAVATFDSYPVSKFHSLLTDITEFNICKTHSIDRDIFVNS